MCSFGKDFTKSLNTCNLLSEAFLEGFLQSSNQRI